jgi:hypothetical protein
MEIHSSIGRLSALRPGSAPTYQELEEEYLESGFTYKSNEILQRTAENNPRHYPYELLLHVVKVFHLNQFEIIFLSHILNDVEPCYNSEPDLFNEDIELPAEVQGTIQHILGTQLHGSDYHPGEQFNIM